MIHEHKYIAVEDGVELHLQIRETGAPVWIIVTHGIGEHLDRHSYLLDLFAQNYNILHYDLRGHGRSLGERGNIDDFSVYMRDLREIITCLHRDYKLKRYCLYGHSMGAMITAGFMQQYVSPNCYPEKVFLSAPPIGLGGIAGKIVKFMPVELFQGLTQLPLSIPLSDMVDLKMLSHDVRVTEAYIQDDLTLKKLHSKLLIELVKTSKEVFSRPLGITCPVMCAVGGDDEIVDLAAIQSYFNSIDKSTRLKVIEGAFHEIHNEVARYREPYLNMLYEFITAV